MDTKALKDKILQLAIQGKLVPQNENDEPASVLLERIKKEKEQLVKDKIIKKEKILQNITEEEKDFDLPNGWEWCRLCDITHSLTLNDGDWILSKDMNEKGSVKLIQLGSIGDGKYIDKGFKNITEDTFLDLKCREIEEGDILINRLLGKKMLACILPKIEGKKITSVDTCFIKPNRCIYNEKFILYLVLSKYFQCKVYDRVAGTTRQRISKGNLITILFPLPPLEEQKRIVAKVDSLFKLIDELDSNKQDLLKNISDTRNKVLQLAIEGKLVPQNEKDEPASVLLEKIKEEKEQLVKDKIIKKEKPLSEINEDKKIFKLPKSWEWVKLGNISQKIHYGYTASAEENNTGIKLLRITDIQDNKVNWNTVPFCKIEKNKLDSCKLNNDDLLIARTGGTIGKSFLVTNIEHEAVFASYLIRVKPLSNISAKYIKIFLDAPFYWEQLRQKSQGTGQPNVNAVSLSNLVMPLPPLEEQERIVAKVDAIMNYLDRLEKEIK